MKTVATRNVLQAALVECPLIAVLRWIKPDEAELVAAALIKAGFA